MGLPSYVINWNELKTMLEEVLEYTPTYGLKDVKGEQKVKGFTTQLPHGVTGEQIVLEWTVEKHMIMTYVAFSQNGWYNDEAWELYVDGVKQFHHLFTKEMGDKKDWNIIQPINKGQTIKIVFLNTSAKGRRVHVDIGYLDPKGDYMIEGKEILPEDVQDPDIEIPQSTLTRWIEVDLIYDTEVYKGVQEDIELNMVLNGNPNEMVNSTNIEYKIDEENKATYELITGSSMDGTTKTIRRIKIVGVPHNTVQFLLSPISIANSKVTQLNIYTVSQDFTRTLMSSSTYTVKPNQYVFKEVLILSEFEEQRRYYFKTDDTHTFAGLSNFTRVYYDIARFNFSPLDTRDYE